MTEKCNCNYCPTIIIPGIGQSETIEVDANGNKIKNSWPLDLDSKLLIKSLALPAIVTVISRLDLGFTKKAGKAIAKALDTLACHPDGTQKHNIRVVSYNQSIADCDERGKKYIYRMVPLQELGETIGENHLFFFAYDIFCRIGDTADKLDEFIQMVKASTGHDKVNLCPVSMGATITTFYLDRYAAKNDINRVVGVVPAYDGSQVVADLLGGNYSVEDYASLFVDLLGKTDGEQLNKIIGFLPKRLRGRLVAQILDSALQTILVNSETMWGIVPSSDYKKLCDRYIADAAHAKLRAATDKAFEIRRDFGHRIKDYQAQGIGFFTLCGYNLQLFKAVNSVDVTSDIVVNTASAALGAHFAPLGKVLPDGYTQKVDCKHNHISPDGCIDASCGALPETTWYYRNMYHEDAANNKHLLTLAKLLLTDKISSVNDDENYPQFNEYVKE